MKRVCALTGLCVAAVCLFFNVNCYCQEDECLTSSFTKSLHYTGEGMRYWYEEQGGFMELTGIPYDQLGCKKCHVNSCDNCHAEVKDSETVFSVQKAKKSETCMVCHVREKASIGFDRQANAEDVHFAAGMSCSDCHSQHDVHGSGQAYQSMRQTGAVSANCLNCHAEGGEGPALDKELKSHRVHKGKLDCNACHVRSNMTCYNCHFERFVETKVKKGNFMPMKSGLLLMNYEDKVTTANVMTMVYKGKKFIAYVPYFTHSIMKSGRVCKECHNNEAIKLIKEGKTVPVVRFKDGKVDFWNGVVPVVPDKLDWVFLDKTGDDWTLLDSPEQVSVQMGCYGRSLTEKQLNKLSKSFGKKRSSKENE